MSKWYKIDIPLDKSNAYFADPSYTTEIATFVEELQYEGRCKRTVYLGNGEEEWRWCFKFKDEIAAMAFKLRWL